MEVAREFEGRDLDEAIRAAAESLGIPSQDVRYELVEGGRRGLFGLGARRVRILVELPPQLTRTEADEEDEASPLVAETQTAMIASLKRMISLTGLELRPKTAPIEGGMRVELSGPDRRLLVQKDGELLNAIQFLLNRMSRRAWPGVGHIQVVCDGYRNRREEDLVELAREVARQVTRTGRPKRLHSMNPYERRLIHIAVREFPGLVTHSEGDGFLKQILVAPAAGAPAPRPRRSPARQREAGGNSSPRT